VSKYDEKLCCRVYEKLLFAYPSDFRRTFGPQLVQVFRDCYRAETSEHGAFSVIPLWLHTLMDLISSAAKEHSESENKFMSNLKRDLVAIVGAVLIIAAALLLLTYGRKNEVSSIVAFGYFLDALVTTGVIGNLIVFVLTRTTRLNSMRVVFTTFLVVHILPLLLVLVIARNDPRFNVSSTIIGYVASFVFWTGFHWAWSKSKPASSPSEIRG
jgi:hypothetical protein